MPPGFFESIDLWVENATKSENKEKKDLIPIISATPEGLPFYSSTLLNKFGPANVLSEKKYLFPFKTKKDSALQSNSISIKHNLPVLVIKEPSIRKFQIKQYLPLASIREYERAKSRQESNGQLPAAFSLSEIQVRKPQDLSVGVSSTLAIKGQQSCDLVTMLSTEEINIGSVFSSTLASLAQVFKTRESNGLSSLPLTRSLKCQKPIDFPMAAILEFQRKHLDDTSAFFTKKYERQESEGLLSPYLILENKRQKLVIPTVPFMQNNKQIEIDHQALHLLASLAFIDEKLLVQYLEGIEHASSLDKENTLEAPAPLWFSGPVFDLQRKLLEPQRQHDVLLFKRLKSTMNTKK